MKTHQVRRRTSTAAKTARQSQTARQPKHQTNGTASDPHTKLSWSRERAAEGGINKEIDPDVPDVHACEWPDGALLDFVSVALYDAEPIIAEVSWAAELALPRALARMVVRRVRVRGIRIQESSPEQWQLALPGLQSSQREDDTGVLCRITSDLYQWRREVVAGVLPRLSTDRASALADALVIAETNEIRNGTCIDAMDESHLTQLQKVSRRLRNAWFAEQSVIVAPGLAVDLVAYRKSLKKGGAR